MSFISIDRYPPFFPRLRRWLFGDPIEKHAFIPLTFKGWKDPDRAKKYGDVLTRYEIEISARREQVRYPRGVLDFHVHGDETQGTKPGAVLAVSCFPYALAREAIKKFLDEAGIIVE